MASLEGEPKGLIVSAELQKNKDFKQNLSQTIIIRIFASSLRVSLGANFEKEMLFPFLMIFRIKILVRS